MFVTSPLSLNFRRPEQIREAGSFGHPFEVGSRVPTVQPGGEGCLEAVQSHPGKTDSSFFCKDCWDRQWRASRKPFLWDGKAGAERKANNAS